MSTIYPRIRHITEGKAMVVTDLHGEGQAYDHIRQTFLELHQRGQADYLIICGDLIHIRRNVPDESLRMILDVMQLQSQLGEDTVKMLMGNHEMPHVYNVTLSKGNEEYTAPFEKALSKSGRREDVTRFLRSIPFFVSTEGGVLITHAGASPAITSDVEAINILTFDHDALIQLADDRLRNQLDLQALKSDQNYLRQAMHYTAISGVDDPRFTHLLRGQVLSNREEEFSFLWDVLFARNEQAFSLEAYAFIVETFLQAIGNVIEKPLNVLVSGHIATRGGHAIVTDKQMRLSSFAHAHPNHAGEYLLLDCNKPINSASDLLSSLRRVFQ